MAARRPTRGPKVRAAKGLERWFPMLDTGLLLLGVGLVLSFSYLAWVIISGRLADRLVQDSDLEALKGGLAAGQNVLLLCLWLLAVVALLRHYKTEGIGFLTAAAGLLCWLGMPAFIGRFSPVDAAAKLQDISADLIATFHSSGIALIVVGFLRVLIGRIILMTYQPSAAIRMRVPGVLTTPEVPEVKGAGRGSIMRKCWELHFCRGSVRTTCPRYVESVPCWRRRSGCYCDHDLAGRLMASVGGNASVKMQVAEELETQQRRAQQLQQRLQRQQGRSKQAARKICRECPIYLEHQKHKYKALSWLAYPATVIIILLSSDSIRSAYDWADRQVADFIGGYSFIPHHLLSHPVENMPWLNAPNAFVVIVGVIVLAVLLQLVEFAVFQLKL